MESAAVGPEARGTDLSVGNALRSALSAALRCRHPASVPWRDRLVEGLKLLGADQAADQSLKFVARQEYKDSKCVAWRACGVVWCGGRWDDGGSSRRAALDLPC